MSERALRRRRHTVTSPGRITYACAAGDHPFAARYERELSRLIGSFSEQDRRTLLAIIELIAAVEAQHGESMAEALVDRMLLTLEEA